MVKSKLTVPTQYVNDFKTENIERKQKSDYRKYMAQIWDGNIKEDYEEYKYQKVRGFNEN